MNKRIVNITLGSDPEMFLKNTETGKLISSVGKIGGTKEEPRMIDEGLYGLQEDNVALEFNIPPCPTKEKFVYHLNRAMKFIKTNCLHTPLELAIIPSGDFDSDQLQSEQAQAFGCSPDFNAWTESPNEAPDATAINFRSCGGHIHIGYDNPNGTTNSEIVKAMDIYTGLVSVILDDDTRRRELYGKAGCYRDKPYGVEYRSLSNFWLTSNELMGWVFDSTLKAIEFVNDGFIISTDQEYYIQEAINNGDKEIAYNLLKEFGIELPVVTELETV